MNKCECVIFFFFLNFKWIKKSKSHKFSRDWAGLTFYEFAVQKGNICFHFLACWSGLTRGLWLLILRINYNVGEKNIPKTQNRYGGVSEQGQSKQWFVKTRFKCPENSILFCPEHSKLFFVQFCGTGVAEEGRIVVEIVNLECAAGCCCLVVQNICSWVIISNSWPGSRFWVETYFTFKGFAYFLNSHKPDFFFFLNYLSEHSHWF